MRNKNSNIINTIKRLKYGDLFLLNFKAFCLINEAVPFVIGTVTKKTNCKAKITILIKKEINSYKHNFICSVLDYSYEEDSAPKSVKTNLLFLLNKKYFTSTRKVF